MQSTTEEHQIDRQWELLSPLLDDAMARLREQDREAIVLRYFQGKSLREVGAVLGVDEFAAQKRVTRALEKLRTLFVKCGVVSTTTDIAEVIAAKSVQAVPAALIKSVTIVAMAKGIAAGGSSLLLLHGALKLMTWSKSKSAIVIVASLVAAIGTASAIYEKIWKQPYGESIDLLETAPPALIIRPSHFKPGEYPSGGNFGTQSGKWMETCITVPDLLGLAYSSYVDRMVLPPEMPKGTYDLMLTLPDHQMEALRAEIKKQFGLTAKKEERETDVLFVRIKDPAKLQAQATKNGEMVLDHGALISRMFDLEQALEVSLHKPVTDQTGTAATNYNFNYDFKLKRSEPIEKQMKYIKDTVLDRCGLEFIPGRERIEMLIVEKTGQQK